MADLGKSKDERDYVVHTQDPINAEPAKEQLADQWTTPASKAYMRNHGDILHVDRSSYVLHIDMEDSIKANLNAEAKLGGVESITLDELQQTCGGKTDVAAALQCAGNRRDELDERHDVEGILWSAGSVLNAKWAGVPLRKVLIALGVPQDLHKTELANAHVHFFSQQSCEQADNYEASIPLSDAMDESRTVMLADTMNGEPLNDEHGGPLRVVVPGFVGARSVKWLHTLRVKSEPSTNFYMTGDYKKLPPDVGSDEKQEWLKKVPPLQETGLQSSVTKVGKQGDDSLQMQGYALDGKGDPIAKVRVCVLIDEQGKSSQENLVEKSLREEWYDTKLDQENKEQGDKVWSWTLFSARVSMREQWKGKHLAVLCRAKTTTGEEQEKLTDWNIRGVENQSYGLYRFDAT